MLETNVTTGTFQKEVLESKLPVLVDFWAEWCGPCRMLAPTLEAIAQETQGTAKVCKVNVDAEPGLAATYGIMSIPSVLLFVNGKFVDQTIGLVSKERILSMLDR